MPRINAPMLTRTGLREVLHDADKSARWRTFGVARPQLGMQVVTLAAPS